MPRRAAVATTTTPPEQSGVAPRTPPPESMPRRGRPRSAAAGPTPILPFGNWRGQRIAYGINLPPELSDRLARHCAAATGGPAPMGSVAVDAIRVHWARIAADLEPDAGDGRFPSRRVNAGRLHTNGGSIRKIFYVTLDEALAIESVRAELGIELGRLHRLALDQHLSI